MKNINEEIMNDEVEMEMDDFENEDYIYEEPRVDSLKNKTLNMIKKHGKKVVIGTALGAVGVISYKLFKKKAPSGDKIIESVEDAASDISKLVLANDSGEQLDILEV